jgi:hypothetical protein
LVDFLCPNAWASDQLLAWPPDVFAVAVSLLHRSGAYTRVVEAWPPSAAGNALAKSTTARKWNAWIRTLGLRWRDAAVAGRPAPLKVREWWSSVSALRDTPVADISHREELWQALLQLCAAADEACEGVGIPGKDDDKGNPFEVDANIVLKQHRGGSLCRAVDPSRARVLPKLRTPRNGLTIRSLSHNLALCPTGEIQPRWIRVPKYHEYCLNLLLIPWPEVLSPSQFKAAQPRAGSLPNMPELRGFFTYVPSPGSRDAVKQVRALFDAATERVARIDGVILPELALTWRQHAAISREVLRRNAFLIAGVAEPSTRQRNAGRNVLAFDVPIEDQKVSLVQHKHHRWKLDGNQIRQYGLGTELDPRAAWWEHISMEPRTLAFVSMRPWLTVSALICEDLARQDPVAELVRSVGPNLVVALLMDAPQLKSRWPARYATVLADDPGSSVLTVTSLGMAALSRPFDVQQPRSRVIALWKDAYHGVSVEVDLPTGSSAAILNITVEQIEEFTADGRSDGRTTGYPVLSGIHFV